MHSYHNVAELRQIRGAGARADSNKLNYGLSQRARGMVTVVGYRSHAPER